MMLRFDALARRHQRAVIGIWLMLVAAAVPFATRQSEHLTSGGYSVRGSQSSEVEGALRRDFPRVSRTSLAVLLAPRPNVTPDQLTAAIRRVQRAVRGLPNVTLTNQSLESALFGAGLVGPILMPLQVGASEDQAQTLVTQLQTRLGIGQTAHGEVTARVLGESALWAALDATSKRELAHAETIGVPILFIVLLTIFGSVSAALLPLALGATSVTLTGALIYFLSLATPMSVFVTNTASMLGIGVAVDYSFFVLARVRQELAAGHNLVDARRVALATSGRAVIFSGITVVASLMGLLIVPIGALRSMALGAMIVVAVSVITTVTLLPALIGLFGERRLSRSQMATHVARSRRPRKLRRLSWARWTRAVTRRPVLSLLASASILATLCVPALSMHTSTGALRQLSTTDATREGFAEAAKTGGPGSLGPVSVIVHAGDPPARSTLTRNVTHLRAIAERAAHVQEVGLPSISPDGTRALFTVVPTVDPESPLAKSVVQQLRRALPGSLAGTEVHVAVGGASAIQIDEQHGVASTMWQVVASVLALAFICMLVLLRSLILPLKAVVFNLLSVGAAYGVLVAIFQWGWTDGLLHYHSLGYLNTFTPPLILAIVFGLSMDYEVFLLSRIREQWLTGGDARDAVASGLASSAQTISSAAFIIVCVFAVFVGTGMPSVKELGLGASVAIALDATLIRLVLVPATMSLLGAWSWWLPRPLERILPRSVAPSPTTSPA
jgi:uncharacterized membrane protein YdfJ with MMPL/SSD domain